MSRTWKYLIVLVLSSCLTAACSRPGRVHRYREVTIASPLLPASGMTGKASSGTAMRLLPGMKARRANLSWATPASWVETRGTGLRMATFHSRGAQGRVQCTIVALSGAAGGLEPNLIRWMRQIHLPVPGQNQLQSFLNRQEHWASTGDLPVTIVDLTQRQRSAPETTPSIIAAVIKIHDSTVFIKMTGTKGAVIRNRPEFESLCRSLRMAAPSP